MVAVDGPGAQDLGGIASASWCGEPYTIDTSTCDLSVFPWSSLSYTWRVVVSQSGNTAIQVEWDDGVGVYERCGPVDPCWIPIPEYPCSVNDEGELYGI